VLVGAATDPDVPRRAGIEQARAFAITSVGDEANVHTAFAAARLNPGIRLVVRMCNLRLGKRVEKLFDDCQVLSASAIAAPLFVDAATDTLTAQTMLAGGRRFEIGPPKGRRVLVPLAGAGSRGERVLLPSTVDGKTTLALSVSSDGAPAAEVAEAAPTRPGCPTRTASCRPATSS
jgi:hypothetical protein